MAKPQAAWTDPGRLPEVLRRCCALRQVDRILRCFHVQKTYAQDCPHRKPVCVYVSRIFFLKKVVPVEAQLSLYSLFTI